MSSDHFMRSFIRAAAQAKERAEQRKQVLQNVNTVVVTTVTPTVNPTASVITKLSSTKLTDEQFKDRLQTAIINHIRKGATHEQ
ncbi:hypothetical protein J1G18_13440 [Pseudomonas sp. MIS38]|uniref:hypothetical protein n=1 Tax=Pseudomonas sp. MIS38 TaxID=91465 RepID=UPI001CA78B5F|nr:hypothetical protein [Pseudomonas sp. MIS38]MBY8958292.1 hypothetical protein [Pseudomonas sp. MIS38]